MSDNDTTQTQDAAAAPRWTASKILIAVIITALVTFGMTALLMNILERRSEQAQPSHNVVELDETVIDIFKRFILPQFPRADKVKVVHADAFEYA